ncbi:ranBP-type and C3HC4-type zinc finger-containing protein 1 isoform X3 [Hypanus sabinus]|uniref:ranBP-type and C3HC4-type zinc finger-containing protein 1 isoform X3 n=1 Tax=Hypanus sabinus TaxID=79690 RepID=UPI0028C3CA3F|nr:ranBP-type and C3HC4-type zinc finger-containing protein 1 isoform X3 [Hypanus sabinus]
MASSDVRGVGAAAALMEHPAPAQQTTVLMSCRVSEGGGGQSSALRLQLSMERPGEFRLGVRHGGGRSLSLYEFNLKDIIYEFKSMTCHGISTRSQPTDQLIYHFEDEEEAQRWSTIINSSLREVEKAISTTGQQNYSPSLQTVAKGSPRFGEDPPGASADIPKPGMDLAQTEDLILRLARAIEAGDCALSSECAVILARQKACMAASLKDVCYPSQQISLRVGVEDATSSATILVKIFPYATIFTLKQQVFQDFGFHPSVQRWIIGQCLAADHRTLSSYGVKRDGDPAFLYLLSAKMAGLPRHQYEEDQAFAVMSNGEPLTDFFRRESLPASERRSCNTLPSRLPTVKAGGVAAMHREGRMDASNNPELLSHHPLVSQEARSQPLQQPSPMQKGWACAQCTFINKPTRPGCEMCSSPRPQDYVVPEEYALGDKEFCRMLQEEALLRSQQELEEERLRNYEYLLQLDGQHLVTNPESLECPICLSSIAPQNGVVLRDCLHSFCSLSSELWLVVVGCGLSLNLLQDQKLVSVEDYNKFLDRSMSVAESSSDNSYHCRTADCKGWCIYEDAVNHFHCPSCGKLNCLLCKAIHEGMNCRQYQDDLAIRAVNDAAARHTKEMLKTLVQSGEAMRCPQCRIIVQKKGGCDWIRCPVCHTEICWVTKKCRWGPGGPGDTSGGCRCLVNGQKCHPLCQNCH